MPARAFAHSVPARAMGKHHYHSVLPLFFIYSIRKCVPHLLLRLLWAGKIYPKRNKKGCTAVQPGRMG
jgi:hypothetical protein